MHTFPYKITLNIAQHSIEVFVDAADGMVFVKVPDALTLDHLEHLIAHLKETIGGKTLLLHSPALAYRCPENDFFKRVMYLKEQQKFTLKLHTVLDNSYKVIVDKKQLLDKSAEISQLLINHADWAGKAEHKRRLYGPEAIYARINNPQVAASGIFLEGQIVGFARVFLLDRQFGYFSDIVVAEEYRGQRLMTVLMQQIWEATAALTPNLLLVAGTPELVATYQRFGFALVAKTVNINNSVLTGFATTPKDLLKEYQAGFVMPPCPDKYLN